MPSLNTKKNVLLRYTQYATKIQLHIQDFQDVMSCHITLDSSPASL